MPSQVRSTTNFLKMLVPFNIRWGQNGGPTSPVASPHKGTVLTEGRSSGSIEYRTLLYMSGRPPRGRMSNSIVPVISMHPIAARLFPASNNILTGQGLASIHS